MNEWCQYAFIMQTINTLMTQNHVYPNTHTRDLSTVVPLLTVVLLIDVQLSALAFAFALIVVTPAGGSLLTSLDRC